MLYVSKFFESPPVFEDNNLTFKESNGITHLPHFSYLSLGKKVLETLHLVMLSPNKVHNPRF